MISKKIRNKINRLFKKDSNSKKVNKLVVFSKYGSTLEEMANGFRNMGMAFKKVGMHFQNTETIYKFASKVSPKLPYGFQYLTQLISNDKYLKDLAMKDEEEKFIKIISYCASLGISPSMLKSFGVEDYSWML